MSRSPAVVVFIVAVIAFTYVTALAAEAPVTAIGTVEPVNSVDVGTDVVGTIKSLGEGVDFNKKVAAGDVLAKVDDRIYAEALELAIARLNRAKAELASNPPSVEVARAKVAECEVEVKHASARLAETQIKSPITGIVLSIRAHPGDKVVSSVASPPLFIIADLSRLDVWANVSEVDVAKLHEGDAARCTCDAYPGRVFTGRVKQVRLDAAMHANRVTYTVVIALDPPPADANAERPLLPFMTAHVEIDGTGAKPAPASNPAAGP